MSDYFDAQCRDCERLADFLDQVKQQYPHYYARPVPPFGAADPRLLIVGLAPGMHGANATGRPFTGDYAGVLLYQTLYDYGFASQPESLSADDDLQLLDCRITNAVKCLPPQNKPETAEIRQCNGFLQNEIAALQNGRVILALGSIAHNAVLRALEQKLSSHKFAHAAEHLLPNGMTLLDSYHCSRYNTQTKRLTPEMFAQVFARARALIG
ncbi:MAG: uracil-DNA glycosylase [Chromatiales bacterium]|jgi:uracil-DNA glycosylase family 4